MSAFFYVRHQLFLGHFNRFFTQEFITNFNLIMKSDVKDLIFKEHGLLLENLGKKLFIRNVFVFWIQPQYAAFFARLLID